MMMEIKVTDDKIEGFCNYNGYGNYSVITLLKNRGRWTLGSSMCLSSDVVAAKKILDTYNKAFEALEVAQKETPNLTGK